MFVARERKGISVIFITSLCRQYFYDTDSLKEYITLTTIDDSFDLQITGDNDDSDNERRVIMSDQETERRP